MICIDHFMIKLARNYWANIRNKDNNSLVHSCIYPNPVYFEKSRQTGYILPEAFIHLDNAGLIQNTDKQPILYQYDRKNYNKKITYNSDIRPDDPEVRCRYKLTTYDLADNHRDSVKKYWWLNDKANL